MKDNKIENLKHLAKEASKQSYAVYSNFPVGAALITKEGKIFTGCNVENISFGLTNCAERTAIFKAISEGYKTIDTIVVYTKTDVPTGPCGACRQVIAEFSNDARIICTCDTDKIVDTSISELLPFSGIPVDLKKE
jgi:cytidine deaminase